MTTVSLGSLLTIGCDLQEVQKYLGLSGTRPGLHIEYGLDSTVLGPSWQTIGKKDSSLLSQGRYTSYQLRVPANLFPIGISRVESRNKTCFSSEVSFSSHSIQLGLASELESTPLRSSRVQRLSR